jgi:hypothetical protein
MFYRILVYCPLFMGFLHYKYHLHCHLKLWNLLVDYLHGDASSLPLNLFGFNAAQNQKFPYIIL